MYATKCLPMRQRLFRSTLIWALKQYLTQQASYPLALPTQSSLVISKVSIANPVFFRYIRWPVPFALIAAQYIFSRLVLHSFKTSLSFTRVLYALRQFRGLCGELNGTTKSEAFYSRKSGLNYSAWCILWAAQEDGMNSFFRECIRWNSKVLSPSVRITQI